MRLGVTLEVTLKTAIFSSRVVHWLHQGHDCMDEVDSYRSIVSINLTNAR